MTIPNGSVQEKTGIAKEPNGERGSSLADNGKLLTQKLVLIASIIQCTLALDVEHQICMECRIHGDHWEPERLGRFANGFSAFEFGRDGDSPSPRAESQRAGR